MKKEEIRLKKAKAVRVLKQQPKQPGLERQVAGEKGKALKWVTCHDLPRRWSISVYTWGPVDHEESGGSNILVQRYVLKN